MTHLILFLSAFSTVFLLGFQQQNVIGRHYIAASIVSIGIGLAQVFLYRLVPTASFSEIIATLAGGPIGITAAMYTHPKIIKRR